VILTLHDAETHDGVVDACKESGCTAILAGATSAGNIHQRQLLKVNIEVRGHRDTIGFQFFHISALMTDLKAGMPYRPGPARKPDIGVLELVDLYKPLSDGRRTRGS